MCSSSYTPKAGLYSAVLSAFLIESYKNLQEDKQDTIVGLLEKIATQNFVSSGVFTNSTTTLSPSVPFEPPLWAIRVNILWFASLVLSIAVASLGILVKQWLREYLAMEYSSPRTRLRARNYRKPALDDWKVFEIAAVLPMILQISVGLFFAGLCAFTSAVHESIRDTTIPVVCAWAFFFFITTIAPLFSPRCPFKTAFLKRALKIGRRFIAPHARYITTSISWHTATLCDKILHRLRTGPEGIRKPRTRPTLDEILEEEDDAVKRDEEDSQILIAVDAVVADDNLLPTMFEVLPQEKPETTVDFMVKFTQQRTGVNFKDLSVDKLDFTRDIGVLSTQAWTTLVDALGDLLNRNRNNFVGEKGLHSWATKSAVLLLSKHLKSDVGIQALHTFIEPASTQESKPARHECEELLFSVYHTLKDPSHLSTMFSLLEHRSLDSAMQLALRVVQYHTEFTLPEENLTSTLNLRNLPPQTWAALVESLHGLLTRNHDALFNPDGAVQSWVVNSIAILLSHYGDDDSGVQALRSFIESESEPETHPACHDRAEILFSIVPIITDDSLLQKTLNLLEPRDPRITVDFVIRVVLHRIGAPLPEGTLISILDLSTLSSQTWSILVSALSGLLTCNHEALFDPDGDIQSWALNSTAILLSHHGDDDNGLQALRGFIDSESVPETHPAYHDRANILFSIVPILADDSRLQKTLSLLETRNPGTIIDFVLRIVRHRAGVDSLERNLPSILNLSPLSSQTWAVLVHALEAVLTHHREDPSVRGSQLPFWVIDCTILLLLSHRGDDDSGVQVLRTSLDSEILEAAHQANSFHSEHVELLFPANPTFIDDSLLQIMLKLLRGHDPEIIVKFVMRIVQHRTGATLPQGSLTSVLHLDGLSEAAHFALSCAMRDLLVPDAIALHHDIPEWALDAIVFLLSVSPAYELPEECAQALHHILALDASRPSQDDNGEHSPIAKHILLSWTNAPKLAFYSITRLYTSLGGGRGANKRPYDVLLGRYRPVEGNISKTNVASFPHPSLFRLLISMLLWRCQRDDELTSVEYEALQAVLEVGVSETHRVDIKPVLRAFYNHRTHIYGWMACYSSMEPTCDLAPDRSLRTILYGSFRAFIWLFKNPYSPCEFIIVCWYRIRELNR